jgi:type I restriction enzyme S subunit
MSKVIDRIITPVGSIPKKWNKIVLQDVSEFITKGATPTTYGFEWVEKGIPFLRSECVSETGFNEKGLAHISEEANDALQRSKVNSDDILISITGNVGRVAIFPKYLKVGNINQHIARVRVLDQDICDRKYIYFQLTRNEYRKYYDGITTGAAYPQLSLKQIRETPIYFPPLPTQRKIATILSAYDDLIENNLKRIKLLEEKAQLTYEEWFVRMKFPGHETAKFDEESGLPEGWEKVRLVDCCDLTMGQSPKSEFYNDEGKGLPFHQGVKDYGFRFPTNASWSTQGSRVAEENSILFSVRAPVGRLNVAIEKIILGRGLASINHKKGWNSFVLYQLQNIFFEDNLMGGGAIFSSVTKKDVEGIKLIHATDQINKAFNDIATSLDDSIKNLTKQNQLLKEARDILLPRLMSGMIDVDELGVKLEEIETK